MGVIDDMIVSKDAFVVGYNEFLQKFSPDRNIPHCFYESKDDVIYYHPIIRRITGQEDAMSYRCRNKDGVLSVYRLIKSKAEYVSAKTAYFIDRDFDTPYDNPDVYETPFYSIENFYSHPTTFEKMLIEQFGMTQKDGDFETSLRIFHFVRDIFHQKVLPLNAFLRCCAKLNMGEGSPKLNIDSRISIKDRVNIDLSDFLADDLPQDFPGLEVLFELTGQISIQDFEAEIQSLRAIDMGQVFRGKFELQFLESFLKRFKNAVEPKKGHLLQKRYVCSIQFSYDGLFTQLGSYAYIPECLRAYILLLQ